MNRVIDDQFYTTHEAADYLRLHPKTLRLKCLQGALRYERVGRHLRFKRDWLDAYARSWREGTMNGVLQEV